MNKTEQKEEIKKSKQYLQDLKKKGIISNSVYKYLLIDHIKKIIEN
jgi:hypothetical protein